MLMGAPPPPSRGTRLGLSADPPAYPARMLQRERHGRILELVERFGYVRNQDLVEELAVSESTIRRDLTALHQQRLLVRTHGGAYSHRQDNVPLAARQGADAEIKDRIAQRAATLIPDGATVFVDGGSTTGSLAAYLAGRTLSLVTNSLAIAGTLELEPGIDVILCGGNLYPGQGVVVGPLARATVAHFRFSAIVIGARGICDGTVWNANEVFADLPRLLVEQHDARRILLADATKMGRRAPVAVCPLSRIDTVVTDGDADHACLDGWDGEVIVP